MAMQGGGYGGPNEYGHHNHHGNDGSHGNSGSNGIVSAVGVHRHRMDEEEEEEEKQELRRLEELCRQLEAKCYQDQAAANETQELLAARAVARLDIEKDVKRMQEAHERKVKVYREKAREINEDLCIRDNRIKELQQRAKDADEEMQRFLRQRQEIINAAKKQERELILSEERAKREESSETSGEACDRRSRSSSSAAATALGNGGGSSNGTPSNMGRRSHSSAGVSFFGRNTHVSSSGREARAEGGGRDGQGQGQGGRSGRSNSQPKAFEQIRQNCVEDNLTNFFGL